jgi:glycosyltransferase involved in cell wall biosynthesis/predicted metal-dependent phosphoesterase TrpH
MISRVDMHCHSTASQLSRLGVQRSLGLPECATPPQEVYELAKRRGMDFVTITDHDTIDGCLELADRPDCFISEELTAHFAGEAQAVHVLCYGITPGDHEWLQAHAGDVEACAAYLHENEVACALAHPFYNVDAPLTRRHRRRLAELFPTWEVRNGSRAPELNAPAVIYIETHGGIGIGGSDDHAGVDIGRTYTEAPAASTPEEFLGHLRRGDAEARGEQGSAAKWAHAAVGFSHSGLYRRARRIHERKLRTAVRNGAAEIANGDAGAAIGELFEALVPAVPYAPTAAFLGAEKAKLAARSGERPRIAVIVDGIDAMHGVTRTIEQIREREVPGFEVEVVGTDGGVDRRLPAATTLDVPFYDGLRLGVPGLPELFETLAEGRYDAFHVTAPGPAGIAATLFSRIARVPLIASYHTELAYYAGLRSGDGGLELAARAALGAFYAAPAVVLSPSPAADRSLLALGTDGGRIRRWERGVDVERFHPGKAGPDDLPGELKILYAGRLTREKGVDLLAESFLRARSVEPRLHLLLAGGGPEEAELQNRLGEHATFLGWLDGDDLARAYASADAFLFCSRTDTYGQVVLEAGASGLPVVAVSEGGPASLIENRHTGILCRPDADHLAGAILQLAASSSLRRRLGAAGRRAAESRSWERALLQLAAGYRFGLAGAAADERAALQAA